MANYKDLYFRLFNRITDAVRKLEAGEADAACRMLKEAQLETEERYISEEA